MRSVGGYGNGYLGRPAETGAMMGYENQGFLERYWLFLLIGWAVWTALNYFVARTKNFDVGGVILASVFLSPLLTYLYIAAVPAKAPAPAETGPAYLAGRGQGGDTLLGLERLLLDGKITHAEYEERKRAVILSVPS